MINLPNYSSSYLCKLARNRLNLENTLADYNFTTGAHGLDFHSAKSG
jgi:hypothetical protein